MRLIRLEIPDAPPSPAPIGLLVPVPPETAHQRVAGMRIPDAPNLSRCTALNGSQAALFLPQAEGCGCRFEFDLAPGPGRSPTEHFVPLLGRYSRPSAELAEAIADLTAGSDGPAESVERIVDFTASLFDYDHPQARFCDGKDEVPLLLTLTKGSCTDINTFLLSSLYAAGIPATYYAGYFFEQGKPPSTSLFHCWIATYAEGRHLDWDIAHHIKNGVHDVRPALNPVPGERVAMSCARGLRFDAGGTGVEFAHFAYPMWIHADGGYEPARAVATLSG